MFGITIEGRPKDTRFAVLRENWNTVQAYLVVQTQWRYLALQTGHIVRTGLDYTGCRAALDASEYDFRQVFTGLQIMEAAILSAENER